MNNYNYEIHNKYKNNISLSLPTS